MSEGRGYPGGSGNPKLSALWCIDVEQASKIVIAALRMHEGNVKATAEKLEVGRTTLKRWIEKTPSIQTALANIRAQAKDQKAREDHQDRKGV